MKRIKKLLFHLVMASLVLFGKTEELELEQNPDGTYRIKNRETLEQYGNRYAVRNYKAVHEFELFEYRRKGKAVQVEEGNEKTRMHFDGNVFELIGNTFMEEEINC